MQFAESAQVGSCTHVRVIVLYDFVIVLRDMRLEGAQASTTGNGGGNGVFHSVGN